MSKIGGLFARNLIYILQKHNGRLPFPPVLLVAFVVIKITKSFALDSGAPAAEGRQAEPHTHISGAPAAEGRQAEPHTHIRKLKGTHELIFSCVSWLAVLLVGAYARRRRRRRRRRWWSRATWRPQLTRKPKRGFSFRGLSL